MLLDTSHSQRRVAFLPWVPIKLKSPKPKDWSDEPVTLGEHLKKVRKERGLLQREVAKALGVDSMSLVNWEKNRTTIGVRFVPAIIDWLGYDPLPKADTLASWIAVERTRRGFARRVLAEALGWDEGSLRSYEKGDRLPGGARLAQLRAMLRKPPG